MQYTVCMTSGWTTVENKETNADVYEQLYHFLHNSLASRMYIVECSLKSLLIFHLT